MSSGYMCTKVDILTSENDYCHSVLSGLPDIAKLTSRHLYLFSHFGVSHVAVFTGLICLCLLLVNIAIESSYVHYEETVKYLEIEFHVC